MKNNKNNLIQRITIALQTLYLFAIFSSSIVPNIYITFLIAVILNISSLILNFVNIFSKGHFKFLFLLITICEILLTIFIFLLPEAGTPAPIQLFS